MSSTFTSTVQFSRIQATEVSKYNTVRVQVSLDGRVQESQGSVLDDGMHQWQEPFCFHANSSSQCEIQILAKRKNFFCWAGSYKPIRKTRPYGVGDLLDASSNGVVKLPLFDWKADKNGVIMGNVIFLIANKPLAKEWSNTRDNCSLRASGTASVQTSPFEMVFSEKSLVRPESEYYARASPLPRICPLTPTEWPSPSSSLPSAVHPQSPPAGVPSPAGLTPHHLINPPIPLTPESHSQLHQSATAHSNSESGVDCLPTACQAVEYTADSATPPEGSAVGNWVAPSQEMSHRHPDTTKILCKPPEALIPEISITPCLVAEPQETGVIVPSISVGPEPSSFSQINIIISSSSRSGSPRSPSEGSSIKRLNAVSGLLHVNTRTAGQALSASPSLSRGRSDEPSPDTTSQPTTSTTQTSSVSCLSPFRDSSSTAATSPSLHSVDLPSPPARPLRQRPKIDTSCVGPRGQVRKYTVPPVNPPTRLRNASLDLPRHEQEMFDRNPSMHSIAPSVSSRNLNFTSERCLSTQRPASRQGYAASPRAPSIRREQLEFDDTQICLDTANLEDQEVVAFLREVDAALSAITNRSAAAASEFLSVPNTGRLSSRQSRRPSYQQLRPDHPRDDWECAMRSSRSVMTAANQPRSDNIPSRYATPLSDGVFSDQNYTLNLPALFHGDANGNENFVEDVSVELYRSPQPT
ncbi:hypothetical protein ID866_3704 [Astraeus odoratus]|nr:hypothetical protein ID866_3704 [Astraeus odoratus]